MLRAVMSEKIIERHASAMSGMRQLAVTKTSYRRAYAAPLARLISGRVEINAYPCLILFVPSVVQPAI